MKTPVGSPVDTSLSHPRKLLMTGRVVSQIYLGGKKIYIYICRERERDIGISIDLDIDIEMDIDIDTYVHTQYIHTYIHT